MICSKICHSNTAVWEGDVACRVGYKDGGCRRVTSSAGRVRCTAHIHSDALPSTTHEDFVAVQRNSGKDTAKLLGIFAMYDRREVESGEFRC